MGKHIKFRLLQMETRRNREFLNPYERDPRYEPDTITSSMEIVIKIYSQGFQEYSIDELFAANWILRQGTMEIRFKISHIGDIKKHDYAFDLRSEYVEYINRDGLSASLSDEWFPIDCGGVEESFFCVPPCPTCMMFMKLYPECSKIINGLIL